MSLIELHDIRAQYDGVEVVKGVSLRLESSELVAILGPSGCGKTTLLRIISGFTDYTGTLLIDGIDVARVPPHRRNIGIVFQDYALFPHQTVARNIGYSLRMRSRSRQDIDRRVEELIDLLRLHRLADRYPATLSGGQRQRVAIARALAAEPKMLLLDEPLSALDKKLREEMQIELRQIQRRVGITTLFVTHDQEEALALADRVVVMKDGEIRQIGSPVDVYLRPDDRFVADFIGRSNFFAANISEVSGSHASVTLPDGATVRLPTAAMADGAKDVTFALRPERIALTARGTAAGGRNRIAATVEHVVFLGTHQHIRTIMSDGNTVDIFAATDTHWRQGDAVNLEWRPEDAIIIRGA